MRSVVIVNKSQREPRILSIGGGNLDFIAVSFSYATGTFEEERHGRLSVQFHNLHMPPWPMLMNVCGQFCSFFCEILQE